MLRPGRRFAISDVIADPNMDEATRADMAASAAIIRASKPSASACCGADALATCCEPATKEDCCGTPASDDPPAARGCAS